MWKYVVAFILIFGLTVYVSLQTLRIVEQAAQQTTPTANGSKAPNTQGNQAQEADKNPKQTTPFWFRFFNWPEGVTAWAILLTLFAIAEQTQQTRKAAEAGLKSAKAALLSAQALINSERPWILITTRPRVHSLPGFDVFAENKGRTTAALIAKYWNAVIVEDIEQLPFKPEWESCKNYPDPIILIPGDSFLVHTIAKPTIAFAGRSLETYQKVEDGSLEAYVFGCVAYRDLLNPDSPSHETGWLFMCVPEGDGVVLATGFDWGEYGKHT